MRLHQLMLLEVHRRPRGRKAGVRLAAAGVFGEADAADELPLDRAERLVREARKEVRKQQAAAGTAGEVADGADAEEEFEEDSDDDPDADWLK